MGIETTICPLLQHDAVYAAAAAHWVEATYPGTSAHVDLATVEVTGPHSARELTRIWEASLLNERLFEGALEGRTAVLESLIR